MGVGFNWFKNYKINEEKIDMGVGEYIIYDIEYLDGDSTSHGYGNRTKLQNIFRKYLNIEIPTIIGAYGIDLIEPTLMINYCNKLLNNSDYDLGDMRERIKYIKELSEKGYYVSYDNY